MAESLYRLIAKRAKPGARTNPRPGAEASNALARICPSNPRPVSSPAAILRCCLPFRCHVGGTLRNPQRYQAMRKALDRLLARPTTLRILRRLVTGKELSFASVARAHCRLPSKISLGRQGHASRTYASSRTSTEEHENGLPPTPGSNTLDPTSVPGTHVENTKDGANTYIEKWLRILLFRQRLQGSDGVQAVWKELRQYNLDLPTIGPTAQSFWLIFLSDNQTLPDAVAYAEDLKNRTGFFYKPLYEVVIRRCFSETKSTRFMDAHKWHHKLFPAFPPQDGVMRRLASSVHSKKSMEAFSYIYVRNHERNVYDVLIPTLCSKKQWHRAVRCHNWLVRMNDLPTGTNSGSALELTFRELLLGVGEAQNTKQSITADPQGQESIHFSRESMNRVLGEVHGVEPKRLDDHFCARIFATKAFSIDVVIRGLAMFGIDEIGPLALREMASRTVDPEKISDCIQRLNEAGVSIGNAVYSQAIRKFADNGRKDLVNSLITTDQHPDAFEDHDLQRKLLSTFIERGAWDEVHRTLAVLTVFHEDPVREQWNILVQKLSSLRHTGMLCKILDDMVSQSISLTEGSLSALQVYQLRSRSKGNAPATGALDHDDTTLIANIWRSTLASGGQVGPERWIEIFKRYGMTERFADVAKLALWLADWYSPHRFSTSRPGTLQNVLQRQQEDSVPILQRALEPTNPLHPLRQIFTNQQLRAFIAWGVRRALVLPSPVDPANSKKPPHYWAQGLRLCVALRARGVYVSSKIVTWELCLQLNHLFGRGRSVRVYNRRSAANVPYSILEMIQFANKLWVEAASKPLMDPRQLVRGPTDHLGLWWAKRLRWDVLQQVQAAIGEEQSSNLPGDGETDLDAVQAIERDFGGGNLDNKKSSFAQAQDTNEGCASTSELDAPESPPEPASNGKLGTSDESGDPDQSPVCR